MKYLQIHNPVKKIIRNRSSIFSVGIFYTHVAFSVAAWVVCAEWERKEGAADGAPRSLGRVPAVLARQELVWIRGHAVVLAASF